jgi:cytochrome c-type biogenesis protein CcmF
LVGLVFKGITTEEKSALLFDYSKGARKHEIRVPYYISRKSGSLYREPYIDYGAYGDVYISPIEYRSGIESLTRFELARGEEKTLGRLAVTFIGFDMDRRQMLSGEAKLLARLQVKHNGGSYLLAPGIQFTRGDERIQLDATVPSTGQRVSLLDFNVSAGSVLVYLQPQAGAQVPPDSVIVEVSFKRLIALVWLGTVLIAAGIFIAMRKK